MKSATTVWVFAVLFCMITVNLFVGSNLKKTEGEIDLDARLEESFTHKPIFNESQADTRTHYGRMNSIVENGLDFMVYATFQFSKMFIEIGYDNSENYDFGRLYYMSLILVFVATLAMALYPVLVVGFILYYSAIFLYTHGKKYWRRIVRPKDT